MLCERSEAEASTAKNAKHFSRWKSSLAERGRAASKSGCGTTFASGRAGRAAPPSAARGGVPPVRGALRQGGVPVGLPRAFVPVRLLVRGPRAHLLRLRAEGLRGRDRPRPRPAGRAHPRRLRRGEREAAAAANVPCRGRELLREPLRRPRLRQPRVLRAAGRRADLPDLRRDPDLLGVAWDAEIEAAP